MKRLARISFLALLVVARGSVALAQDELHFPISPADAPANGKPMSVFSVNAPDYFQGTYRYRIPIAPLPAAKGGLIPEINLSYNSRGGFESPGYGWTVDLDYIARDTSYGVPKYRELGGIEGEDHLVFKIGAHSGRLVFIDSPAHNVYHYRAVHDDGSMLQFYYHARWSSENQQHWLVKSKDGMTRLLGYNGYGQDKSADGKIFAWYITERKDANGNKIETYYSAADGVLKPTQVKYDMAGPYSFAPRVEFTWQTGGLDPDELDDYRISYHKGFRQEYKTRLKEILVTGYDENGQADTRKYELSYQATKTYANGTRGLPNLAAFEPEDSAPGFTFPETTFQYTNPAYTGFDEQLTIPDSAPTSEGFNDISLLTTNNRQYDKQCKATDCGCRIETMYMTSRMAYYHRVWTNTMMVDMDGDGDLDRLLGHSTGWWWNRNLGNGHFETGSIPITMPSECDDRSDENGLPGCRLEALQYSHNKFFNTFELCTNFSYEREIIDWQLQRIQDMTGDGRADLIFIRELTPGQSGAAGLVVCPGGPIGASSIGWQFGPSCEMWSPGTHAIKISRKWFEHQATPVMQTWDEQDLIDMNGDGLPDLVTALENTLDPGRAILQTQFNEPKGRFEPNHTSIDAPICSELLGQWRPCLRAGAQCESGTCYSGPINGLADHLGCQKRELIDTNGDGLLDIVSNDPDLYNTLSCAPKDANAFKIIYGKSLGFDDANTQTPDLTGVDVMWNDGHYDYGSQTIPMFYESGGQLIDMNGDGLVDLVSGGCNQPGTTGLNVRLGTGHDFLSTHCWTVPNAGPGIGYALTYGGRVTFPPLPQVRYQYLTTALMDLDGDGLPDWVDIPATRQTKLTTLGPAPDYRYEVVNSPWEVYRIKPPVDKNHPPVGRLSQAVSKNGLKTEIEYARATYREDLNILNMMPFPLHHVLAVKKTDLTSGVTNNQFILSEVARWDEEERMFLGFRDVTVTNDAEHLQTKFSYNRGNICKLGSLDKIEIWNSLPNPSKLRQRTTNTHTETYYDGGKRCWARPDEFTTTTYDDGASATTKRKLNYFTDPLQKDLGLVSSVIHNLQEPEERREVFEFTSRVDAYSPSDFVYMVRQKSLTKKDQNLDRVGEMRWYYDAQGPCPGSSPDLQTGRLCQKSILMQAGPDVFADYKYTYDLAGRLIQFESPDRGLSFIDYHDAMQPTPYVRQISNELGHELHFREFHPLTGTAQVSCGPQHDGIPSTDNCRRTSLDKYGRLIRAEVTLSDPITGFDPSMTTVLKSEYDDTGWANSPPSVTTYHYPASADPTRKTVIHFDTAGRTLLVANLTGSGSYAKAYRTYDSLGRPKTDCLQVFSSHSGYSLIERNNADCSNMQYDVLGRLLRIENLAYDPQSQPDDKILFSYLGWRTKGWDENSKLTEVLSNKYGEVVEKKLHLGAGGTAISTYQYDGAGRLTKAVDPNGAVSEYDYYPSGLLMTSTSPSGYRHLTYTRGGLLATMTKGGPAPTAQTTFISTTYDPIGRVAMREESPMGSDNCMGDARVFGFEYDQEPRFTGLLTRVFGPDFELSAEYDSQGNPTCNQLFDTADGTAFKIVQEYNALGNVTAAHYPGEVHLDLAYSAAGDLRGLAEHAGRLSTSSPIDYTPDGLLDNYTARAGQLQFSRSFKYDTNRRLKKIDTNVQGVPWKIDYDYYTNGQLFQVSDSSRNVDHYFYYDGANRLSSADGYCELAEGTSNQPGCSIAFQLEKNSALAKVSPSDANSQTYGYTANKTILATILEPGKGTDSFTHNSDGQRCSITPASPRGHHTYRWTPDGQLQTVAGGTPWAEEMHWYDHVGNRFKTIRNGQVRYEFGPVEVREGQVFVKVGLPGGVTCRLPGVGGEGAIECYFSDHKNMVKAYRGDGSMMAAYEYLPYGQRRKIGDGFDIDYGFDGAPVEAVDAMLFYGGRYHDPIARQWLSPDPLHRLGATDTIAGINTMQPYVFNAANPIGNVDSNGMKTKKATWEKVLGISSALATLTVTGDPIPTAQKIVGSLVDVPQLDLVGESYEFGHLLYHAKHLNKLHFGVRIAARAGLVGASAVVGILAGRGIAHLTDSDTKLANHFMWVASGSIFSEWFQARREAQNVLDWWKYQYKKTGGNIGFLNPYANDLGYVRSMTQQAWASRAEQTRNENTINGPHTSQNVFVSEGISSTVPFANSPSGGFSYPGHDYYTWCNGNVDEPGIEACWTCGD